MGVGNVHGASRNRAIELDSRREKHQLWTEPEGLPRRDGGVNAELPGFSILEYCLSSQSSCLTTEVIP